MIGQMIGGFFAILVGVTLMPTIADNVVAAENNSNVTAAGQTIVGLTTIFASIAVISAGIGLISVGLKKADVAF
jgi:hypothetical protein